MSLAGKTILTTRAASQSPELRKLLEQQGARVLECPAIRIVPPDDWTEVDNAVRHLNTYHWLLFTSTNAVEPFMKRVETLGVSVAVPIAVVGSSTAARLQEWNLVPSLIPDEFRAEGLLAAMAPDLTGIRILFPRAETAREILPAELRRRGAAVDIVTVYRTVKADPSDRSLPEIITTETIDCIVFTSPSTVRYLAESVAHPLAAILAEIPVAVIGPVTRDTAQSFGLNVAVQPKQSTLPDLVESLAQFMEE